MTPNTPIMPIEFWRAEMGYNPWHFWGIQHATVAPVNSKCNDVLHEYSWQGADEVGRSEIRKTIMAAEKILFDNLSYWPGPVYSEDTLPWPKYVDRRLYRTARRDAMGGWVPVTLNEGYIQAMGVEELTLVQAGAAVVYSDADGDGVADTFTVTVPTTVTNPAEIAVYFVLADRVDDDSGLSARWRIEPVHVVISGGNAVIKGKRWLAVIPKLYESKANYPFDAAITTPFITTCDVYRRHTNANGLVSTSDSQSALIWESRPCDCCGSGIPSSTDPAAEGWVAGRAGIRMKFEGVVVPAEAVYDATTGTWSHPCTCFGSCGEPDRVLVRYLAGLDLDQYGWVQKTMRTMVSRLAAAEMTARICACDVANKEWSNWAFDVARVTGPEQYQANLDVLNNPLGTRRGHIFAWQQIKSLARSVGMLA